MREEFPRRVYYPLKSIINTSLIFRRLRELEAYTRITPTGNLDDVSLSHYNAVVLSGSTLSVEGLTEAEFSELAGVIVEDVLKEYGLCDKVWRAFAVVGDNMQVGVKGYTRDYGYVVTVRVMESSEDMTTDWIRVSHEVLDIMVRRVASNLSRVAMTTYAIASKPLSTTEPC